MVYKARHSVVATVPTCDRHCTVVSATNSPVIMVRGLIVFLLVVGLVWADEDGSCSSQDDCDCGSACNDGTCEEGCQVFDMFLAAGSTSDVYGRSCECGTDVDAKGRPIMCEEDVKFEGAPDGVKMFVKNQKC